MQYVKLSKKERAFLVGVVGEGRRIGEEGKLRVEESFGASFGGLLEVWS